MPALPKVTLAQARAMHARGETLPDAFVFDPEYRAVFFKPKPRVPRPDEVVFTLEVEHVASVPTWGGGTMIVHQCRPVRVST